MKHHNMIRSIGLISLILSCSALASDTTIRGFVEPRIGARTQNDPYEDQMSLAELRAQLDALTYFELFELQLRADFLYDALADDPEKIDLRTGEGFIDLREANVLFSPASWSDLKVGRQILTWGTGDLLFINDLFPKDWQSFLLGRDEDYLKAPSDAIYASFFPSIATIDVAYIPQFNADRHLDGSRLSYWNPGLQRIAGQDAVMQTDRPDDPFQDHEVTTRIYRNLKGYETALYLYHGYWKSPAGMDPATGRATFPHLNVYGASTKGQFKGGILNLEAGYYDSREDRNGTDPTVANSQIRYLIGYDRELRKNLSAGLQYYLEQMLDHDDYLAGLPNRSTASDEFRHLLTLRLTQRMMNQNLILSLFTFYSPSDHDLYIRPAVTYKIDDHWQASLNAGFFWGKYDHTFFGQFKNNSNLNLALRYSF
jgi:hypothetical protein